MLALTYDPEHPWHRQPCDTEFSWPIFQAYRDLPRPRCLTALAEATGKAIATIRSWYEKHGWALRVAAWDDHLDRKLQAVVIDVLEEDAKARARRHIGLLLDLEELVTKAAKEWLKRAETGEKLRWTPRELTQMTKTTIELQRLIYGETTANVHNTHDLGQLTLEELQTLRALQLKAGQS